MVCKIPPRNLGAVNKGMQQMTEHDVCSPQLPLVREGARTALWHGLDCCDQSTAPIQLGQLVNKPLPRLKLLGLEPRCTTVGQKAPCQSDSELFANVQPRLASTPACQLLF